MIFNTLMSPPKRLRVDPRAALLEPVLNMQSEHLIPTSQSKRAQTTAGFALLHTKVTIRVTKKLFYLLTRKQL